MTKKEMIITFLNCFLMILITCGAIYYCRETNFVIPKSTIFIWTPWVVVPVDRTCFIIVIAPIVLTSLGYLCSGVLELVNKFREK